MAPNVEEAEEQNQELGRVAVLEQGRGREVARPPNGMVLNKPNSNYQRGRATIGEGRNHAGGTPRPGDRKGGGLGPGRVAG